MPSDHYSKHMIAVAQTRLCRSTKPLTDVEIAISTVNQVGASQSIKQLQSVSAQSPRERSQRYLGGEQVSQCRLRYGEGVISLPRTSRRNFWGFARTDEGPSST